MRKPDVPRIDHLAAYHLAIDLLKTAGFQLSNVSLRSETCYYWHPGRDKDHLLRVSTHASKKSPMGLSKVCAKVAFSPKAIHTEFGVRQHVTFAIGRYFLNEPPPSRYLGKRAEWEYCVENVSK